MFRGLLDSKALKRALDFECFILFLPTGVTYGMKHAAIEIAEDYVQDRAYAFYASGFKIEHSKFHKTLGIEETGRLFVYHWSAKEQRVIDKFEIK